jgi:YHS domain-containing protein
MKATDPVCKMTIEKSEIVVTSTHGEKTYYFCSKSCKEDFDRNPESFIIGKLMSHVSERAEQHTCPMHPEVVRSAPGACPICGMALEARTASLEKEENLKLAEMTQRFKVSTVLMIPQMRKSILAGLGGAAGLISFYFVLVALLSGSWQHPLDELLALKYWIGPLIVGFGIQVGLFYYIRKVMYLKGHGGRAAAAGTSTSTVAMVACCAHHLTDVLPVIGLAGLSLFLSEYKTVFIALGIVSNAAGIVIMLRTIRRFAAGRRVSDH